MEKVIQTSFKILYNNKDITRDITNSLISIVYTDNTEGKSDELEINLEDSAGLWRDGWYPNKGDTLVLHLGYNTELILFGSFEIDEINLSGPPDVVSVRSLATGVKNSLRTKKSYAHENKTLLQIAQSVASQNGFQLQSGIAPIVIGRCTQNDETDLSFLKKIGEEYGYLFSVRNKTLTFLNVSDIELLKPVLTLDRSDLMNYSISDKTLQTYSKVVMSYHKPQDKSVVNYSVKTENNKDDVPFKFIESGDTLVIKSRVENQQQAEAKAKAALYKKNSLQQEGNLSVEGNPYLLAGNNFELTGMGAISGIFHIMSSTHKIDRGGAYTVDLDIKRVGFVLKVKVKPKKKRKTKYTTKIIK